MDLDAEPLELPCIVQLVIESDNALNVQVLKRTNKVFGAHAVVRSTSSGICWINRAGERYDFVRDNPAQIGWLKHLVKLSTIKAGLLVPLEFNCALHAFKTVDDR